MLVCDVKAVHGDATVLLNAGLLSKTDDGMIAFPFAVVLFAHPKVAVFGIPDEFYGEEIIAWIQLHADLSADEGKMRALCPR